MADIFHEVEEDLRRDRLNKLWTRYGSVFVTIALVAVLGTAGIVFWRQYEARQAAEAAESFAAVDKLLDARDVGGALTAYGKIAAESGNGYGFLAQFRQAGLLVATGDLNGALAIYDKISNSGVDERMKAIARLRAAYAVADSEAPDALIARVAPMMGDDSPWRYQARDISAFADYRAKRVKEASEAYAALAADPKVPDSLRQRAASLAAFMAGGAEISPATLPAAVPAPTEAPPEPAPAPTDAPKIK